MVAAVHSGARRSEPRGDSIPSGKFIAEYRRLSEIAQAIGDSAGWEDALPQGRAAEGKIVVKREFFRLGARGEPEGAPRQIHYRAVPRAQERDLKTLLRLDPKEAAALGLPLVADTKSELARAEQFHETHIDLPTAVFAYSLVPSKRSQ